MSAKGSNAEELESSKSALEEEKRRESTLRFIAEYSFINEILIGVL